MHKNILIISVFMLLTACGGDSSNSSKDREAPVVAEVAAIDIANSSSPEYIFNSSEAGKIIYSGACQSVVNKAIAGDNVVKFSDLNDGEYNGCYIQVKDKAGNISQVLAVSTFNIDTQAPSIEEVAAIASPSKTYSPFYSFNSDEAGTIVYGGDCSSSTDSAIAGDNTIRFNELANGSYSNCTIQVIDNANNSSTILTVSEFTVAWAKRTLNDTGQIYCADYSFLDDITGYEVISASGEHDSNLDCAAIEVPATQTSDGAQIDGDMVRAGQDAVYGRDATDNDNEDGHAGFSFSRLDNNGSQVDVDCSIYDSSEFGGDDNGVLSLNESRVCLSMSPWACVQDNITGLIWEVKQGSEEDIENNMHAFDDDFSWYSSDFENNGGAVGYYSPYSSRCDGFNGADRASYCNTEDFIARVNSHGLCGFKDWRLPTKYELANIVSNDRKAPAIDYVYFPNTVSDKYWTSSAYAIDYDYVWAISFFDGDVDIWGKYSSYSVRLVRGKSSI